MLWGECYLNAILVGLCPGLPYVLPRVCLYQEAFPVSNSLRPARPGVVSHSCPSHDLISIHVIVTGSITTFKCNNIICNNKNKLVLCHVHTTCTLSSATQTTHTVNKAAVKHTWAPLLFFSQTRAGSDFRPCGLLNIYQNTHQPVCHFCLQESDLWGFFGENWEQWYVVNDFQWNAKRWSCYHDH